MPKYQDTGLGTTNSQQPISVKFPPTSDRALRDKDLIPDRSTYIRAAVLAALIRAGFL